MEDKLRVEAKNLVEQIKATRNKLKSANGDSDEFVLQGSSGTQAPQLLTEPKRRRLLKGRFGFSCSNTHGNLFCLTFFVVQN